MEWGEIFANKILISHQNIWLRKSVGLAFSRTRGWRLSSKGAHKFSHTLRCRAEATIWKSSGQTLLLILSFLERQGNSSHSGDKDAGDSHTWSPVCHEDTGAGKHHFGTYFTLLVLDMAFFYLQLAVSSLEKAWQSTGSGQSHTFRPLLQ